MTGQRLSDWRRVRTGCIVLLLLVGLTATGRSGAASTDSRPLPQVTDTPTSTQTTSPLPTPTPTSTPTVTPTPSQTPTATATLRANQVNCFQATRLDGSSVLLAWHVGKPITAGRFDLARAEVIGANLQTDFIPSDQLQPPISQPTPQEFTRSVRFTANDSGLESGKIYVYRLDVIGRNGQILDTLIAYSPATGSQPYPEICHPEPLTPTATPTPTITPIVYPTYTHTPTRTPTPTWTPTPTITPTPTWTPTPLPTNTLAPPPTETFTPFPTPSPFPNTDTPTPTWTATPTLAPVIETPTPSGVPGDSTPQENQPDTPPDTPTPVPPGDVNQPPGGEDTATPVLPAQQQEGNSPSAGSLPGEAEKGGDAALATLAEESALAEVEQPPAPLGVNEFRPRLIPQSRVSLFRAGLFGMAGLAFTAALIFVLAAIGWRGK